MGGAGRMVGLALALIAASALAWSADSGDDAPGTASSGRSSLSYRGHENEADCDNLIASYPAAAGTRIDDCQTCHRGGAIARGEAGGGTRGGMDGGSAVGRNEALNPCSYCHLVDFPEPTVVQGAPASYEETLNSFGLAYKRAGRNVAALEAIAGEDADGDGYANGIEIEAVRYPGDASSTPAQKVVPIRTLTWEDLQALARHEQFLLMNAHRQRFDEYANYAGVRMLDLLNAAGVPLTEATTITCFAPDGYARDFTYEQITAAYPPGRYYPDLDPESFADPEQGFVKYAERIPEGLNSAGDEIPGRPWLMVAYAREGGDLAECYLDAVSGRLEGEGPYRLIVPQSRPGAPDRDQRCSPSKYEDGYDFDGSRDYNSGQCIRGLVAIRVNPMPAGYEEFDWKNGGYALLARRSLILYGAGAAH